MQFIIFAIHFSIEIIEFLEYRVILCTTKIRIQRSRTFLAAEERLSAVFQLWKSLMTEHLQITNKGVEHRAIIKRPQLHLPWSHIKYAFWIFNQLQQTENFHWPLSSHKLMGLVDGCWKHLQVSKRHTLLSQRRTTADAKRQDYSAILKTVERALIWEVGTKLLQPWF